MLYSKNYFGLLDALFKPFNKILEHICKNEQREF